MMMHLLPVPTGKKLTEQFFQLSARAEWALLLVAIVTVFKLLHFGLGERILILFLGASVSALLLYGLSHPKSVVHAYCKPFLYSLCRYIPYFFGLYLFFFEGFWRLAFLLKQFSLVDLALAAFFFIGGNIVVSAGYMAMEYVESLRNKPF